MRMSANLRDLFLYEAFLYYNPLLLMVSEDHYNTRLCSSSFSNIPLICIYLVLVLQTMMVWFWGINLWVFAQANVNYSKIFDLDQNHLSHREIWKVTYTCQLSCDYSLVN